jgi:hypothetical protein
MKKAVLLMAHTTLFLVMCFGPGALVKNFPKREAFECCAYTASGKRSVQLRRAE